MTLSCIQQPHEHLHANLEHGVLTLAINRAEAKNALCSELYLWIAQALDEAGQGNQVRVVVLRGQDAGLSAGNAMQGFMKSVAKKSQASAAEGRRVILLKAAAKFSTPLSAA